MPSRSPKFEFDRELGRGTTGRVWLAHLTEPFAELPVGAEVAVKVLQGSADPRAREAFAREARAGQATRHAHLVRILHEGENEEGCYVLMEYVPGRSLRDALEEHGRMPEPQVRSVIRQVAEALGALHAAGWRHGDIKPENVRLDALGRAVLLDLGFAQPIGEDCDGLAPRPGSLHYLSPEQARGAQAGPESDVFALGVIMHELATGEHPFQPAGDGSASADRWLESIRAGGQVTPSHTVLRLSPFFDAITRTCLESKPDRRPSAATLGLILDQGEAGTWWRWRIAFGSESRRDTVARSDSSSIPFVGRDGELVQLGDLFEQARTREAGGGAAWLEGTEGSGKSRLVSEFVHRVRRSEDPPLYLYGRCTESEEDRPGQPIRQLLQRWLHLPRHQPVGPRERELLEALVPPALCKSLVASLEPEGLSTPPMAEAAALAEWLVRLGSSVPLIVFLDDLTFAGEVTLEILGRVAAHLRGTRTLLLLGLRWGTPARRPVLMENLRARLATHVPTATVPLPPLDESAALTLVEELFHHSTPRLRLARALHERSSGSPGVMAEMVRGLLARGQARPHRDERTLELLISPDELPLPRSVGRLIADRYQELPAPERLWLQRLAVVGGNLESGFLLRAFPATTPAQLDQVLTTLVDEGWLAPVGDHYRFARPAQREAVLRGLSEERRGRVHAAAAHALEELPGKQPSVGLVFQRAYHLHAAGKHLDLLEVVLPLIARARESGHPSRVHTLATWGLEAIEALPHEAERESQRLDLLESAADAADRLGRRTQQREFLDRLSDLEIDAETAPRDVGRVYHLHGRYAANTGQYGLSRGMLRNAVLLFRRAGDRRLECAATLRLAYVQGHVGEVTEAQRLSERAFELAVDDVQQARANLALAVVAIVSDQFERALRNIDRAMALLRRREDPTGGRGALAAAYLLRARTYRLVGRPRRAFGAIRRAERLAAQAGEKRLGAEIAARLGRLYLDVARPRDAELQLREALLQCAEIEYRRGQVLASVFLGILLAESEDPEAPHLLSRATELASRIGLHRMEATSLALRARLARRSGDLEQADIFSLRALEILERFGGELADRLVIFATRAVVLEELGRHEAARSLDQTAQRRVRRVNEGIEALILRQRHHRAMSSLWTSARSITGPVFPRVALVNLPGDAQGA